MSEFVVINGHAPWCAYIRDLHSYGPYEEPCDCSGWDDDTTEDDYDDYYVDGDTDW